MAQRKEKRFDLLHPGVTFTVAGLLIGATFRSMIRTAPQARPTPPAAAPAGLEGSLAGADGVGTLASSPAPVAGEQQPLKPGADLHAMAPLPSFPPPPASRLVGPPAPVRGPEWKGAPLPVISPDVLQAMLNPRAVRRAQHLRRLGFVPPPEPAPAAHHPAVTPPIHPPAPKRAAGGATVVSAASGAAPGHPAAGPEADAPEPAAPAPVARQEQPEVPDLAPGPAAAAGQDGLATASKKAGDETAVADASSAPRGTPGGEGDGNEPSKTETPPAAGGAPIWLRARLDHPQSEYQVGEWVAVRFLASRPVHLRVYRVDAAGHVTRVFSTYSREDRGSPARTFSMMVKAGDPQPGPEGMVAIGSARPLTRDELLACLRAYLAEGPSGSAGVPAAPAAPSGAAPAAAPSLADVLKTVIDAVGRAADMPDAPAAPLDRSAWSVAVGRFVSADRKLSAVATPHSAGTPPGGS